MTRRTLPAARVCSAKITRPTHGLIVCAFRADTRSVDELLAFIENEPRPGSPKAGGAKAAAKSSKAAKRQRQREARRRLQSSDEAAANAQAHEGQERPTVGLSDSNDTAGSSSEVRYMVCMRACVRIYCSVWVEGRLGQCGPQCAPWRGGV